jgi:hypothetical protein
MKACGKSEGSRGMPLAVGLGRRVWRLGRLLAWRAGLKKDFESAWVYLHTGGALVRGNYGHVRQAAMREVGLLVEGGGHEATPDEGIREKAAVQRRKWNVGCD